MFDKITKTVIEAVYVDNAKNSANFIEKTFAACASIIPIMLSLTSLLVAYWAYSANQEGMAVVVRRDKEAELGVGSPDVAIGPAERTDIAYIATWQISIVNTSLTATIPLTGYMIKDVSAYGAYVVLHSGSTKLAARMIYSSGANITLPLSLKPGEVVNFVLKATVPVSTRAFPKPPVAIPASPIGSFILPEGEGGLDPFGNAGRFVGEGWAVEAGDVVLQPCISASFESSRGHTFTGAGYWYQNIYRIGASGSLPILTAHACG